MLTNKMTYSTYGGVVETHRNSGRPAPIDIADFFVPEIRGCEEYPITPRVYFHGFSPRSLNGFEVTFETGEMK